MSQKVFPYTEGGRATSAPGEIVGGGVPSAAVDRCARRSLVLALGLPTLVLACGDDGPAGSDEISGSTATAGSGTSTAAATDETAAPPMLEAPYGACAGEQATTECIDAGPAHAQCLERADPQGMPYSTCAVTCHDDADCPPVGAGNITPTCWGAADAGPGLCLLDCNLGANSCALGTICIDGAPPTCMWPGERPGHPDAQSFCDSACGPCGATLLLPWTGDCASECVADLADCSEAEQTEIFACTGGETCPVGGAVVAGCIEGIACVTGTGR
jgi:hypothetical protein